MGFPQDRQETKVEYPRRLMKSITCSFRCRHSRMLSRRMRLNTERFPAAISSRMSATAVSAIRLSGTALLSRMFR